MWFSRALVDNCLRRAETEGRCAEKAISRVSQGKRFCSGVDGGVWVATTQLRESVEMESS